MSNTVYGICDNKCLKEVIAKENFAIIETTQALNAYPEGFTSTNCIVIGCTLNGKTIFNSTTEVQLTPVTVTITNFTEGTYKIGLMRI